MVTIKEIRDKTKVDRPFLVKVLDFPADYITWLFLKTSISPNAVTVLRVVLQLLACLIIFPFVSYSNLIIGVLCYQFLMILDSVDGKLARMKQKFSMNGLLLDRIGHYVGNTCFLLAYTFAAGYLFDSGALYILGMIMVIFMLLEKSVRMNSLWFPKSQRHIIEGFYDNKELTDSSTHKSSLNKELAPFFKVEYPFGVLFFGTIFGLADMVIYFYFVLYSIYLVRNIIKPISLIKKYEGIEKVKE